METCNSSTRPFLKRFLQIYLHDLNQGLDMTYAITAPFTCYPTTHSTNFSASEIMGSLDTHEIFIDNLIDEHHDRIADSGKSGLLFVQLMELAQKECTFKSEKKHEFVLRSFENVVNGILLPKGRQILADVMIQTASSQISIIKSLCRKTVFLSGENGTMDTEERSQFIERHQDQIRGRNIAPMLLSIFTTTPMLEPQIVLAYEMLDAIFPPGTKNDEEIAIYNACLLIIKPTLKLYADAANGDILLPPKKPSKTTRCCTFL